MPFTSQEVAILASYDSPPKHVILLPDGHRRSGLDPKEAYSLGASKCGEFYKLCLGTLGHKDASVFAVSSRSFLGFNGRDEDNIAAILRAGRQFAVDLLHEKWGTSLSQVRFRILSRADMPHLAPPIEVERSLKLCRAWSQMADAMAELEDKSSEAQGKTAWLLVNYSSAIETIMRLRGDNSVVPLPPFGLWLRTGNDCRLSDCASGLVATTYLHVIPEIVPKVQIATLEPTIKDYLS